MKNVYIIFHFIEDYLGSGSKRQDMIVTPNKKMIPDLIENLAPTTFPESPFVTEDRRVTEALSLPKKYWSYETVPFVTEVIK